MARTGQSVVDRAWVIAQDNGAPAYGSASVVGAENPGTRWSSAEALMWLNDVQLEIVTLVPKANAKRATPTLAAGTRQTLDGLGLTDGIIFLDVVRNYSLDGGTPGRPVTKIPRIQLDDSGRYWHNEQGTEVNHWTQDEDDPTAIYVYPACPNKVEVIYSAAPADLTALSQPISLRDTYANALMYGLLARFYSKDATYGKNPQIAASMYQLMQQALGITSANAAATQARRTQKAAGA